jgi:hypothetical protein
MLVFFVSQNHHICYRKLNQVIYYTIVLSYMA